MKISLHILLRVRARVRLRARVRARARARARARVRDGVRLRARVRDGVRLRARVRDGVRLRARVRDGVSATQYIMHLTALFRYVVQGEFIQTHCQRNGYCYGLTMAAVEQVAQQGLACVTHMSIEACDSHVTF